MPDVLLLVDLSLSGAMMKALLFACVAFISLPAIAEQINCRVVGISDGDTLTCLTAEKHQIKVRLAQIDAPEKDQAFGQKSRQSLADMTFGKDVVLHRETTDKYGRTVAKVVVAGQDANLQQVSSGMAWVYKEYAREPAYFTAEREARASRVGLWSDPNPVRPSDWRHGGRKAGAVTSAAPADLIAAAQAKKAKSGGQYSCGGKTTCGEMNSCEEAYHYLQQCGVSRLDRDKDGIPCESICR